MKEFRLPSDTERMVIFGRTGSGKTVFATWMLSMSAIENMPWIIIDHKDDAYLKNLPRVEEIKLGELPKYPGLYRVAAKFTDDEAIDVYMHRILAKGRTGLFTDEGSKIPQAEPRFVGLKSVFAQGRSKHVPVIFATQRPSWINKSVMSEGDYYAAFHLQNSDDRDRVQKVMTEAVETPLDEYHCHWYDVKQNLEKVVSPVNDDQTMQRLDERLKPRRTFF